MHVLGCPATARAPATRPRPRPHIGGTPAGARARDRFAHSNAPASGRHPTALTRPTCPGGAGSGRPAPQPRTRDWSYGRRLLPIYCPLRPGEEGTKFNGGAGPARRTHVRRPPPSALVEGRRAPSSTCSACNKLVGQLPQSWPFALGRAGFSHHEGAFYRSPTTGRFLSTGRL